MALFGQGRQANSAATGCGCRRLVNDVDAGPQAVNCYSASTARKEHVMIARLLQIWDGLRTSLWLVPTLMVVAAGALGVLMSGVDELAARFRFPGDTLFFVSGPEGARAILSTIAGSMISVAGVVFSITMVVLSLASGQFGPRLVRGFMHDRGNQLVLGTFIATFVYCIIVIRSLGAGIDEPGAHPSVSVGIGLALASLFVLIYFIHHTARSIQAPRVIAAVGRDLDTVIAQLYPQRNGGALEVEEQARPARERDPVGGLIRAAGHGYVQTIDTGGLVALAVRAEAVLELLVRPGDHVAPGQPIVCVVPTTRCSDELGGEVNRRFGLGEERTPLQDVGFPVQQLVEIALRALSPGINDPFTAIQCIDRLSVALLEIGRRRLPDRVHHDGDGQPRLLTRPVSFCEALDLVFDPLRRDGAGHVAVVAGLLAALSRLAEGSKESLRGTAIRSHADALLEDALRQPVQERDRQRLLALHRAVVATLSAPVATA